MYCYFFPPPPPPTDSMQKRKTYVQSILRGRYSSEFLMGVCRLVLQILTLLQTKKCHFPPQFSDQTSKIHTRFQIWPLGRNYVIIT